MAVSHLLPCTNLVVKNSTSKYHMYRIYKNIHICIEYVDMFINCICFIQYMQCILYTRTWFVPGNWGVRTWFVPRI